MSADLGRQTRQTHQYRLGFVVEQTLGHRTHYRNLQRFVAEDEAVAPTWMPIEFTGTGLSYRLPGVRNNWSARASWLASQAVRQAGKLDAVFYHTQVTALLSPFDAHPTVISLDATPINFDTVGHYYGHISSGGRMEQAKFLANRRAYQKARALVAWCSWAKNSLMNDYGVPEERIAVIPPGVDLEQWPRVSVESRLADEGTRRPRLLFVGGDFERKGGKVLLECFTRYFADQCDLWLLTQTPIEAPSHVTVYNRLTPNSPELLRLYAEADIFVFPTLSDCAPLAIPEAMAAALPVISTAIGAIPEMVRAGETGLVVEPREVESLRSALERLLANPRERAAMGAAGLRLVETEHDAQHNIHRLMTLVKAVARGASGAEAVALSEQVQAATEATA